MKVNPKISYIGHVKLTATFCGEVIEEKDLHNQGGEALWDFLATCLAGRWNEAEVKKPYKIKLFYYDTNTVVPKDITDTTPVMEITDYISITSAPIVDEEYNAVFHFLVPYTYISDKFNHIRLYSASAASTNDYLARVNLVKNNDTDTEWDTVEKGDSNMVWVLDWYMKATNMDEGN